ncbi:11542_t:CDS:2 [Ambispora leptoticha]|uniref:11542_t:CDS:1 n=1 Tax=Ambispora leptoticha TaxID=144679 RepID=A0A9N8ZLB1_9GLOM|nr:11542_t:CDS:2 [Ambispora leptoticha]
MEHSLSSLTNDESTIITETTSLQDTHENSSSNINYSSTISSISSILTDQLPTNLDQFLARRTSSSASSLFGASSITSVGSHSTLDINAQEVVLKEKSKKGIYLCTSVLISMETLKQWILKRFLDLIRKKQPACADIELYTRHLLNDSSLGLYHMSEHIRKKVPQFVEEKKNLIALSNTLDLATANITDSRKIIENISNLKQFTNITNLLKNTLEIIEKK